MTTEAHRDIAELILNRPGATEADLLRAIAHAVLAGYRAPLRVDAYNPDRNVTTDDTKPTPPQPPPPETSQITVN